MLYQLSYARVEHDSSRVTDRSGDAKPAILRA